MLEFDEGYSAIRFCYYDHAGPFDYAQGKRFQRSSLIVSDSEMQRMREALPARG